MVSALSVSAPSLKLENLCELRSCLVLRQLQQINEVSVYLYFFVKHSITAADVPFLVWPVRGSTYISCSFGHSELM